MNKIERNEMIIKLTKENKTNAEIIKAIKSIDDKMPISDDTIRKVRRDNGLEYNPTNGFAGGTAFSATNDFVGGSTFSTEELYKIIQSLQDEIIELKDDLAIDHAKIQSLEADIIKASKVHCNELKSDKKYIVKRLSTREFIAYANEDELGRYIKLFGANIPIATIDNSINERSNWICRADDILLEYTTENIIDNVDYKSKLLQNKHDSLEQALNKMMDLQ